MPVEGLLQRLQTTTQGLTSDEASGRLVRYGPNRLQARQRTTPLRLLLGQFGSPITLLLIVSAVLSFFLGESTDALIILAIVLLSGLLGFWQEYGADNAVQKLLAIIQIKATVRRDGTEQKVPAEAVVPGDVVTLDAGDSIPGDCRILQSRDLFVDEAALTGETYPVEKAASPTLPEATALARRTNVLFMGTHVISGTATAMIVRTGPATEFGQVSTRLRQGPPETEFERGIRRYGNLLVEVTLVLVIVIFAVNVYFQRPVIDAFLFALSLAIGLTPQLLPAIVSIVLSQGARRMAADKVIVKRLVSIENFGSMDVLCSDKTGTLTEGVVKLHQALDVTGQEDDGVFRYAYLNAFYETGFANPIDQAIRAERPLDMSGYSKLDEIPYDFGRKRLSVLVAAPDGQHLMVTKGALANILDICSSARLPGGTVVDLAGVRAGVERLADQLSGKGFRLLGVAFCEAGPQTAITKADESHMTLAGLLVLNDQPKPDAAEMLDRLEHLGVALKGITGDSRQVAGFLMQQFGVPHPCILSGPELHGVSDEALCQVVGDVDVFAEVEPNQKERIILALQKAGHVVGFLGDGINDASALHAADVGISVDSAVDVAKEAADIVLLDKSLRVLERGVREGRKTFANTLKYINITTSANFGNMASMAAASLFLPFLPMLPKQILVTNFLTDIPAVTIATDNVDDELVARPRRWNVDFIRHFMLVFGLISSAFDFLTFGVLLFALQATPDQFRTGWFVESTLSELFILLVIRTRRPFFKSLPSRTMLAAVAAVAGLTLALPYSPLGVLLGLSPLSPAFLLSMCTITALYICVSEVTKAFFYKRVVA